MFRYIVLVTAVAHPLSLYVGNMHLRIATFCVTLGMTITLSTLAREASASGNVEAIYEKVKSAVVRIEGTDGLRATGVVVSKEGHVAVYYQPQLSKEQLVGLLSGGRRVKLHMMGASEEFRLCLLKIETTENWPHVAMAQANPRMNGQSCIAVGYSPRAGGDEPPVMHAGRIDRTAPPIWGTTNCERWQLGDVVFDTRGRLVGVITQQAAPSLAAVRPRPTRHRTAVHTLAAVLCANWSDFAAAGSVDKRRIAASKEDTAGSVVSRLPLQPSKDAVKRARAASVRIRRAGADQGWGSSGTIVSADGHIISCGHHFLIPGHQIAVTLSDGSEVDGEILGTNWVTDLCVAKITRKGNWPYVEFGDSLDTPVEQTVFTMGYPARRQADGQFAPRSLSEKETRIVRNDRVPFSIRIASDGLRTSGESGGGLFDARGRLVGIGESLGDDYTAHVRVEIDAARLQRTKRTLERVWKAIENGHFYPAPTAMGCPSCSYRQACRAWTG